MIKDGIIHDPVVRGLAKHVGRSCFLEWLSERGTIIMIAAAEIQKIAPFELWLHSAAETPATN